MARPRRVLVDPSVSGVYHCWSRCVRKAYLCGNGCGHRRDWLRDRLRDLVEIFAIDVATYAIMDNHLHVILRTDPDRVKSWSGREVARRYVALFPWRCGVRERSKQAFDQARRRVAADPKLIETARERLSSLSWFMRCLKEGVARRANAEDGCKGHFWEKRFDCRRLLDEAAVLTAMVYVDLNPIRAGIAKTPEQSEYTSLQERVRARRKGVKAVESLWLAPIQDRRPASKRKTEVGSVAHLGVLNITPDAYLAAVDAGVRNMGKSGAGQVGKIVAPILERLQLDRRLWLEALASTADLIGSAIGSARSLAKEAVRRGDTRIVGALPVYREE